MSVKLVFRLSHAEPPPAMLFHADLFLYFRLIRGLHANDKNTTRSHLSSLLARPSTVRTFAALNWRPRQAANRRTGLKVYSQSERCGRKVGGSWAAPERDIEVVEERRLVGHECHSLRVPIIWRGVCSARPVRLSRWKSRRSWNQT